MPEGLKNVGLEIWGPALLPHQIVIVVKAEMELWVDQTKVKQEIFHFGQLLFLLLGGLIDLLPNWDIPEQ